MDDELRTARRRLNALVTTRTPETGIGGSAVAAQTTHAAAYPGGTAVTFLVVQVDITGDDAEGAAVTLTPAGDPFPADNLGTARPPEGTAVLCRLIGNRYVFRYDG